MGGALESLQDLARNWKAIIFFEKTEFYIKYKICEELTEKYLPGKDNRFVVGILVCLCSGGSRVSQNNL